MEIPFSIRDPFWSVVHPGMPCRIKHRIVLIRHGESESNAELTTTGRTSEFAVDTSLTEVGQEQAQDVAKFFESKCSRQGGFDVHTSLLSRAIHTALPTIEMVSCIQDNVYVDYNLREIYKKQAYWIEMPEFPHDGFVGDISELIRKDGKWLRRPETNEEFRHRVSLVLSEWKTQGTVEDRKQTIVFTHSKFISEILAGDGNTSFHLSNGSISVVDIDEKDNLHVQQVNYTGHLKTPTGMHVCMD